jgi:hypothetical protein
MYEYCCYTHLSEEDKLFPKFMIGCRICGNKRCPRATDCSLECTNSNEPGQKGSRYK